MTDEENIFKNIDPGDFILVQKPDGTLYKLRLQNLSDAFISIADNPAVDSLFDKIESMKLDLLELQENIKENYSTTASVLEKFETIQEVNDIVKNESLLNETQVLNHVKSAGCVEITKTEDAFYKEESAAYHIFENVTKTISGWTN